jgi:hypothetical protein
VVPNYLINRVHCSLPLEANTRLSRREIPQYRVHKRPPQNKNTRNRHQELTVEMVEMFEFEVGITRYHSEEIGSPILVQWGGGAN